MKGPPSMATVADELLADGPNADCLRDLIRQLAEQWDTEKASWLALQGARSVNRKRKFQHFV